MNFPKVCIFFFILILQLLAEQDIHSQIFIEKEGKKEPLENMILQVKQVDEFVARFNYKADFFGKPVSEPFTRQFPRKRYIDLLFDKEDPRVLQGNPKFSSDYIQLKLDFVEQVVQKELKIFELSDKTFAIAECLVTYKSKTEKITLVLRRFIGENFVKWVIVNIHADFLNLKSDKSTFNSMPPNSHETDFISLKRTLDKRTNLHHLAEKSFEYEPLSVFFFLVDNGDLKFQYVKKLNFMILGVSDWIITLSEFNRNSENSGWLISNIAKKQTNDLEFLGID